GDGGKGGEREREQRDERGDAGHGRRPRVTDEWLSLRMAVVGAGREGCRSERRSASPSSADGVMVRPMKPFRRKATFAIVAVVAVAVVGLPRFHVLASARGPSVLGRPTQPGLALGRSQAASPTN